MIIKLLMNVKHLVYCLLTHVYSMNDECFVFVFILYTSLLLLLIKEDQCFNCFFLSVLLAFFRFSLPRHRRFTESKLVLGKPVCLPCSLVSL